MSETRYGYRCGIYHPIEEMRLVEVKGFKRWRCIKSIKASKKSLDQRDAYGWQTTAANRADMQP